MALQEEIGLDDRASLQVTLTTLFKIVTNISANPMEPKFRKLGKTSKALNDKILKYKSAVSFVVVVGFKEEPEQFYLAGHYNDKLEDA